MYVQKNKSRSIDLLLLFCAVLQFAAVTFNKHYGFQSAYLVLLSFKIEFSNRNSISNTGFNNKLKCEALPPSFQMQENK